MSSADRDALLALFRWTRGVNWWRKDNWDTNAELADWYGVDVDADGRVVKLSLGRNYLQGTIPKELGALTKLQQLHLSSNKLTGSIPKELGAMTEMQQLRLNDNQLSGSIPTELGSMTKMQQLSLGSNRLTGSIPKELGALTAVRTLNLFGNELTGSIPEELGALTEMQQLLLSHNMLTGSIPKELGAMTQMKELSLNNNQLTGSIPKELGAMTAMQQLSLSSNKLTGSIPKEIGDLTAMWKLCLFSNKLTGSIPKQLGALTAMQELILCFNKLTGSIPKELGALTQMKELSLNNNQLTGSIPEELGDLAVIRILHLRSNELTGNIPKELGALKEMQDLSLKPNKLTDMRDWAGIPEEREKSRLRAATARYSDAGKPFIVRLLELLTDAWHVTVPVVDDVTDVLLLTSTADPSSLFWWICLIALVVADIERLWLFFTLCSTIGLLPFLWCLDAFQFFCLPNTESYYLGRTAAVVFARLNCRDDAPQNTLLGRLWDSVLWVLFGSRSRCSPLWHVCGMSLDASIDQAHHAGVGFRAIDRWVDRHPFRVFGKALFGSGFKLKTRKEGVSRRAGVMIRAVGETLVVDSLFVALSFMSFGWDDNIAGVAGISAIFSILELVTELQYYVEEAGAVLEPVETPERDFITDPPDAVASATEEGCAGVLDVRYY